jgi:hypothetical protein
MVMKSATEIRKGEISQMTITYPNGAKQVVKPNMTYFKGGHWQELAKSIAGQWYLNSKGEVINVPIELS